MNLHAVAVWGHLGAWLPVVGQHRAQVLLVGPVSKAIDAQAVAVGTIRVPLLQGRAGDPGLPLGSASRQQLQGLPLGRSDPTLSAFRNLPINDGAAATHHKSCSLSAETNLSVWHIMASAPHSKSDYTLKSIETPGDSSGHLFLV